MKKRYRKRIKLCLLALLMIFGIIPEEAYSTEISTADEFATNSSSAADKLLNIKVPEIDITSENTDNFGSIETKGYVIKGLSSGSTIKNTGAANTIQGYSIASYKSLAIENIIFNNVRKVFYNNANGTLYLTNVQSINGTQNDSSNGVITNKGLLTITGDSIFKGNSNSDSKGSGLFYNYGTLKIVGDTAYETFDINATPISTNYSVQIVGNKMSNTTTSSGTLSVNTANVLYNTGTSSIQGAYIGHNNSDNTTNNDAGTIYNTGNLTIQDSFFDSNKAQFDGIGIANIGGDATLTLKNTYFINGIKTSNANTGRIITNKAGGTIKSIENVLFSCDSNNQTGAISNNSKDGTATIELIRNSIFNNAKSQNNASNPRGGGAIWNNGTIKTIEGSEFNNNIADYGGAISNQAKIDTITDSKFANNIAVNNSNGTNGDTSLHKGGGAALYIAYERGSSTGSISNIVNTTFTGNQALKGNGGAIYVGHGSFTIKDGSYFANNRDMNGLNDMFLESPYNSNPVKFTINSSDTTPENAVHMLSGLSSYDNTPVITKTGIGNLYIRGKNDNYQGSIVISEGTLNFTVNNDYDLMTYPTDKDTYFGGTTAIASGATLNINIADETTIGDTSAWDWNRTTGQEISGTGTITKSGLGWLNLSGDYSGFTGNFKIEAGRVVYKSDGVNKFFGGTTTIKNGSVFELNAEGKDIIFPSVSGAGTIIKEGTNKLIVQSGGTFSGDIWLNDGTLEFLRNATTDNFVKSKIYMNAIDSTLNLTINETTTPYNFTNTVISIAKAGNSTNFVKDGAGTVNLNSDVSAFNGNVEINAGTVKFNDSNSKIKFFPTNANIKIKGSSAVLNYISNASDLTFGNTIDISESGTFKLSGKGKEISTIALADGFLTFSNGSGYANLTDATYHLTNFINPLSTAPNNVVTFKDAKVIASANINYQNKFQLTDSILDMQNFQTEDLTFQALDANGASQVYMDLNLSSLGDKSDTFNLTGDSSATSEGEFSITKTYILDDDNLSQSQSAPIQIIKGTNNSLSLKTDHDSVIVDWATNLCEYKINAVEGSISGVKDSIVVNRKSVASPDSLRHMNRYRIGEVTPGGSRGFNFVKPQDWQTGSDIVYTIAQNLDETTQGSFSVSGRNDANCILNGDNQFSFFEVVNNTIFTIDDLTIQNAFRDSSAKYTYDSGSVIYAKNANAVVHINSVTAKNNTVTGNGGVVYNDGTTITIDDSTFNDNRAGGLGGAIYATGAEDVTVTNSKFYNNVDNNGTKNDVYLGKNTNFIMISTGEDNGVQTSSLLSGIASEDSTSKFIKASKGITFVGGTNSNFLGETVIQNGTLQYTMQSNADTFFGGKTKFYLGSNLVIDSGTYSNLTVGNFYSAETGAGTINKVGSSLVKIIGNNDNFTGQLNILEGTLQYRPTEVDEYFVNGNVAIKEGAKLCIRSDFDETIESVSGYTDENNNTTYGIFEKEGTGTLTYTGDASKYHGNAQVYGGVLVSVDNYFDGGKTTINDAKVQLQINNDYTINTTFYGNENAIFEKTGTATLYVNGDNSNYLGKDLISQGTVVYKPLASTDVYTKGSVQISDGARLIYDSNGIDDSSIQNISSTTSNSGTFIKREVGTLNLIGNNSNFTGLFNITGGKVNFVKTDENTSFVKGTTSIVESSTLNFGVNENLSDSITLLSGRGVVNKNGVGTLNSTVSSGYMGTLRANAGILNVTNSESDINFRAYANNSGTLRYTSNENISLSSVLGKFAFNTATSNGASIIFSAPATSTPTRTYTLDTYLMDSDTASNNIVFENSIVKLDSFTTFENGSYKLSNSILDIQDGAIETVNFGKLTSEGGSVKIDAMFTDGILTADKIINTSGTQTEVSLAGLTITGNSDNGLHLENKATVLQGLKFDVASRGTKQYATTVYNYNCTVNDTDIVFNAFGATDANSLKVVNQFAGDSGFLFPQTTATTYVVGGNLENTATGTLLIQGKGSELSTIDANSHSLFELVNNTNLTIKDVTIQNANGTNGSAIYLNNSGAKITSNNVMYNNNTSTTNGGAIAIDDYNSKSVNITGGTFKNNKATGGLGGAIYANTNINLTDVSFEGNTDKTGANDIYFTNYSTNSSFTVNNNSIVMDGGIASYNNSSEFHKKGSGTLELKGQNANYKGYLDIEEGNINYTQTDASYSYTSGITNIRGNSTLSLNSPLSDTNLGTFWGSGKLNLKGGKTFNLTKQNASFTGTTTVSDGSTLVYTAQSDSDDGYFNGSTVLDNGNLTFKIQNTTTNQKVSNISGIGNLAKVGTGTLTINGNLDITGTLSVDTGNLIYNQTSETDNFVNGNISTTAASELTLNLTKKDIELSKLIANKGTLNVQGGKQLTLNGVDALNSTGTINVKDNSILKYLSTSNNNTFNKGTTNLSNGTSLIFDIANSTTNQSVSNIAGEGNVTKQGNGNLAMKGDFSGLTGNLNIENGTIDFSQTSTTDTYLSGHTTIASTAGLTINTNLTNVSVGNISGSGSFTKAGDYAAKITGDNSLFTGNTTISGGKLSYSANSDTDKYFSGSTKVDSGAELALNISSGNQTIGKISGAGTVGKYSAGSAIFTDVSAFTGNIKADEGTLTISNNSKPSFSTKIFNNSTLKYNTSVATKTSDLKITFDSSASGATLKLGSTSVETQANYTLDSDISSANNNLIFDNTNISFDTASNFNNIYSIKNSTLNLNKTGITETFNNLLLDNTKANVSINIDNGILDGAKLTNNSGTAQSLGLNSLLITTSGTDTGLLQTQTKTLLSGINFTNSKTIKQATTTYEYDVTASGTDVSITATKFANADSLKVVNQYNGDSAFNFPTVKTETYNVGSDLGTTGTGSFKVTGQKDIYGNRLSTIDASGNSLFEVTQISDLELKDVIFANANRISTDTIKNGSALYADNASAKITSTNVDYKNNTAYGNGGAIAIKNANDVEITDGVMSGNTTTTGRGGAIYSATDLNIQNTNFSNNNDSFGANDIYLANGAKLAYTATQESTIADGIASADNTSTFTKEGSATLNIKGTNAGFTGQTVISNGNLNYTATGINDSYLGGSTNITSGSKLILDVANTANTQNLNGVSGAGDIEKNGNGNINLNGDFSSMSGNLAVNGGNAIYNQNSSTDDYLTGNTTVANGANLTLNYSQSDKTLVSGQIAGAGNLTLKGGKTFSLNGGDNSSLTGNINIDGSTLNYVKNVVSDTYFTGKTNISNSGKLLYSINYDGTIETPDIAGNGTFEKAGVGTMTVKNGSNSDFTGNIVISEGTLKYTADDENDSYYTGKTEIKSGATLKMDIAVDSQDLSNVSGAGTIDKTNSGTLAFGEDMKNFTGNINIEAGTLKLKPNVQLTNINKLSLGENTTLDMANSFTQRSIEAMNFNLLNLSGLTNLKLDVDLANKVADQVNANYVTGDGYFAITKTGLNIISDTSLNKETVSITESPVLYDKIQLQTGEKVYGPVNEYKISYANGSLTFSRDGKSYNPTVYTAPVSAQAGSFVTQLNTFEMAFDNFDLSTVNMPHMANSRFANQYAVNEMDPTYTQVPSSLPSAWFKPYATIETVHLNNGPDVKNNSYGSLVGGDSPLYNLGHGFKGLFSVYGGYNGSHQTYEGNSIYQNGGQLGATAYLYKGKFFQALTANVGAAGGSASTKYGSEDFTTLSAGVATKLGYNWDILGGKIVIQPNYQMSYSMIKQFDYHNALGTKISSDPLNAMQIVPGIRLIGNIKGGWQPYIDARMVFTLMDETSYKANGVSLPEMSMKPYFEYGLGVQKMLGDYFTGYLMATMRAGGRQGVTFQSGLNWKIGKFKEDIKIHNVNNRIKKNSTPNSKYENLKKI